MHQNKPGIHATNAHSSHASLLLSTTPTMINSPLQNNTNNPQQTSTIPSQMNSIRRQPSAQLSVAGILDHDSHINTDSPLINPIADGYINFKKPQNEIFKKLDGRIQRIVAAHSNLNKLYALNDFSSLGAGPKRPFELPPQLPPPPPWIPKVAAEYGNQWNDDSINPLGTLDDSSNFHNEKVRRSSSLPRSIASPQKLARIHQTPPSKAGSLTIDSAITKLHQRRQQQQLSSRPTLNLNQVIKGPTPSSSSSSMSPNNTTPTITPAQFSLLAQKIKETLETECGTSKDQGGNLSGEDKKKFQEDLIALLKEGITAVTKNAKLKFNTNNYTTPPKNRVSDQKSLLLKSSPQTLFNTIRRETSLLLSKRDQGGRASLSLLSDQQSFNRHTQETLTITNRQPISRPQTIKVVMPPTEYYCSSTGPNDLTENATSLKQVETSNEHNSKRSQLTYQVIKNKIRLFQESHQIYLGKSHRFPHGLGGINPGLKRKKSAQKSLDKIVDRLQAKWSPSPTNSESPSPISTQKMTNLQKQIIYSSASLLQSSRVGPSISAPTPIPVFRSPLTAATKGAYYYPSAVGASKIVNLKSKKSKRPHPLGLRLGNYLERECPQPNTEKLTIEQFARCLNLVRSNDAVLQRHQEQLLQSDLKWRMPMSNRPLRLRRLRGVEKMHMPASASYRATKKVGLQ